MNEGTSRCPGVPPSRPPTWPFPRIDSLLTTHNSIVPRQRLRHAPAGQSRLEDFIERPVRTLADLSKDTATAPEPGDTDQIKVAPGTAPKIAATASGTVVRTDDELPMFRITLDRKSTTLHPSLTLLSGRVNNYGLYGGQPLVHSIKYLAAHRYRQRDRQSRRRKKMAEAVANMSEADRFKFWAWTDQRTPALAIVARGDQVRALAPNSYSVRSQSDPSRAHTVSLEGVKWRCECAFFSATGMACVHIFAVRFKNGLEASVTSEPVKQELRCDSCQSVEVVRDGVRHNKSGDVSTYLCKTCGRRFAGREGFHKRRADPNNIARALDLYFRGLSIRKVREYLEQVERLQVSHMTVYRWIAHYSQLAAEWMDAQGARTSDRWHVDETVVNVNGAQEYLWNVLDHDSRFLLATHVSQNRSLDNTRAPLRKAKKATPDRPLDVLTDGMNSYPVAIAKELGRRATALDDPKFVRGGHFNPHKRVPSIRAKESNNRIERFHGTEKERFKVMRAFDGEPGTAILAEGFRVHYNLVRDHQALGMTPGEAAGIPLGDGFRWKRIIEEASRVPRIVTPKESR